MVLSIDKHVPKQQMYGTIEELLDPVFPLWAVPYQRIICGFAYPPIIAR
jgi:hypothetical protein